MGTQGAGLYQDDVAQDIRDEFKDQLRRGKTGAEITQQILSEYADSLQDIEDGPIIWMALADTQWNLGRLQPEVKAEALRILENGGDLWRWDGSPKLPARKQTLEELRQKLNSPQPPEKKMPQYRLYRCPWAVGDVFAYPIESELAKEKGLAGRYFLIQKVDEGTWHPGHIVPIVYVKLTAGNQLPTTVEEYDRLEYVQTGFTRYEWRFYPIDGRRPQEDIAEKAKLHYEVDEYGFLPEYRILLVATSKKAIPPQLKYIGNFQGAMPPKREFIPHAKISIKSVMWKHKRNPFETRMIQLYCGHNRRELPSYQKKKS